MNFLERVAREVVGGEVGANLGALGVSTFCSTAWLGVSKSSSAAAFGVCSSISVSASSSSSSTTSFSLLALAAVGNRSRGFTAGREAASPSVNFLKSFFPRL